MKRIILFLAFFLLVLASSRACTAFCYLWQHGALLAKNLDWPVDKGLILLNRAGISKTSFASCGPVVYWTSMYNSISLNQFGKEFPLGGMNEKGLVVEELNVPPVQLQSDCRKLALNEFQVVQYLLDNFASVAEVEMALSNFRLEPLFLHLHYLIMDREGCACIMEFDGGAFVFYHPDQPHQAVLSNNPYQESLRYLGHFEGFGGMMEVKHRGGSNERFVSVAHLLSKGAGTGPVDYCFGILDTVSQPDTRWSLVYDPQSLCIYLKFQSCSHRQEIHLDEYLDRPGDLSLGTEMGTHKGMDTIHLGVIRKEENRGLMETVFQQLQGELDLRGKTAMIERMIGYSSAHIKP